MRIQFASQFAKASTYMPMRSLIKPIASTLMLLGNTVNPWTIGGRDFVRAVAGEFENVYIIPGPAEYSSNRNECHRLNLRRLWDETARYSNVQLMHNKRVELGDIDVVGGTLWTDTVDRTDIKERILLKNEEDSGEEDILALKTIRNELAVSMRTTDRNFFNGTLLEARVKAPERRIVFASYFMPHPWCITSADIKAGSYAGAINDYRYMMRRPLQLWLCGAGLGGRNYWDSETGIVFAKNARGDDETAATGYSPEMFMDVGTMKIRDRRAGIDALTIVAQDSARADLPPVPAPDVDFFPENTDDMDPDAE
jgi:hypothetical protein